MVLRGLVKCSSLFFIVFLMSPKRTRLSAPISKQQEYVQAIRRSYNELNDLHETQFKAWTSISLLKQKQDDTLMGLEDEPGFDLNDDEIRKFKLWPKGMIPYYIDVLSFNDKVLRDRIRLFLNEVNGLTRVNFMEMPSPPKDDKSRWVFFVNRRGQLGCADHSIKNFTNEGVQQVILGYDCMSTHAELAEAVLAIAGIPPQHNSPDRDEYITTVDENIMPDKKYLFEKLDADEWLFYDVKYDFSSAGHYHYHKYSVNGRATIEAKAPYTGVAMGETNGFSESDIKKLRMLYNYIVNKKEDKVPECDKLFRRGQNFHKGQSQIVVEIKPRKKPNKYLGLPEQEHSEHDEDSKEKDENEEDEEKQKGSNDEEHDDENNYSIESPSTTKLNLKSHPLGKGPNRKAKKSHDPLTYLSDYQTGDDRRKAGRRKINKNK